MVQTLDLRTLLKQRTRGLPTLISTIEAAVSYVTFNWVSVTYGQPTATASAQRHTSTEPVVIYHSTSMCFLQFTCLDYPVENTRRTTPACDVVRHTLDYPIMQQ
jgi:hypothetical protein